MLLTFHKFIMIDIFCGNILPSELSSLISCLSLDRKNKKICLLKMSGEFVLSALVQSSQELMHTRSSHGNDLPTTEFDPSNCL